VIVELVSIASVLTRLSVGFLTSSKDTLALVVVKFEAIPFLDTCFLCPPITFDFFAAAFMFVEFILIASVLTRFSIGLVATGIYTLAFVTVEGETLATLETSFHVPFRALPLFTMARVLHKVVRVSLCGTGVSIRFFANLRMLVAFAVFVVEVPPLTLLSTRMSVRVLASLGFRIGFGMFVALAIFFDKVPAMSFVGTGVSVGVFASLRCRVWL
jgi:hypothetical protein